MNSILIYFMISMVVSVAKRNGVIGTLIKKLSWPPMIKMTQPWTLEKHDRRLEHLTQNKALVMDGATRMLYPLLQNHPTFLFESTDLYFRHNIQPVSTIEEVIHKAPKILPKSFQKEILVLGGSEVFKKAFPYTKRIYLTLVQGDHEGDQFLPFPLQQLKEWKMTYEESVYDTFEYQFYTFER